MSARPTPFDAFPTSTSSVQAETENVLSKYQPDPSRPPVLDKTTHMQYLIRNLVQGFPARYASQDASQPWLMFWTLHAFSILQVGLDPGNKQKAIDTILKWQHPDGGFGGGPGQAAHLLPTYAATCALAIAGRPGPGGGWDQIDRKKMYQFFMSLKQPDGSFHVAHQMEVDARGIYCLLATSLMLDILTPELVKGTATFVASCQTYEGGFASSSQPYFTLGTPTPLAHPRPALGEAHGGYTFCYIASWLILHPFIAELPEESRPTINTKLLLRWLVQMQGIESELGGFKGRTNKLVDGCYSWWVGGAFALIDALGVSEHPPVIDSPETDAWDDADDALFDRNALQEYVLLAGQHPAGGLRDKPPKGSDAYHTMYCLAGLSAAQHRILPNEGRLVALEKAWVSGPATDLPDNMRRTSFCNALSWTEEEGASKIVGGAANRVNGTHPLFNLTITHTEGIMAHFYQQSLPARVLKKHSS